MSGSGLDCSRVGAQLLHSVSAQSEPVNGSVAAQRPLGLVQQVERNLYQYAMRNLTVKPSFNGHFHGCQDDHLFSLLLHRN